MNSQNVRPIQVTYNGMKNYIGVLAPMRAFKQQKNKEKLLRKSKIKII